MKEFFRLVYSIFLRFAFRGREKKIFFFFSPTPLQSCGFIWVGEGKQNMTVCLTATLTGCSPVSISASSIISTASSPPTSPSGLLLPSRPSDRDRAAHEGSQLHMLNCQSGERSRHVIHCFCHVTCVTCGDPPWHACASSVTSHAALAPCWPWPDHDRTDGDGRALADVDQPDSIATVSLDASQPSFFSVNSTHPWRTHTRLNSDLQRNVVPIIPTLVVRKCVSLF